MADITKVLFGAFIGLLSALVGDYLKRTHASRIAAMMILRELAFHKQRLKMAIALDDLPDARYELKFPSPVWQAQASQFIAGAPLRKVEPILNWYASMAVLGYSIGRLDSPNGLQVVGPDRSHLSTALNGAYMAAMDISRYWTIGKEGRTILPLFEEANNSNAS